MPDQCYVILINLQKLILFVYWLTHQNNFLPYALPFKLLFPCLPKGIFPFPSNHRQPQLSSNGKCKEKPGIMKSGVDASFYRIWSVKAFGMMNFHYEIRICQKICNRVTVHNNSICLVGNSMHQTLLLRSVSTWLTDVTSNSCS